MGSDIKRTMSRKIPTISAKGVDTLSEILEPLADDEKSVSSQLDKSLHSSKRRRRERTNQNYEIKGARERSYLDLSQLKIPNKGMGSDDTLSDITGDRSPLGPLTSSISHNETKFFSSSRLSRTDKILDTAAKPMPKFMRHVETPAIFHGSYATKQISKSEMSITGFQKLSGFSQLTFLPKRPVSRDTGSGDGKSNVRVVLEVKKLKTMWQNRRGFYSEVVSPYLRPERILLARQKEEEMLAMQYLEMRGEEDEIEEEESIDGDSEKKTPKVPLKEWPPIYKILNPEPALAEFDLPVAFKEPTLISKGRMPKFAPHLQNIPTTNFTEFLQPEEKWIVYESEPNIAFPVQAFQPRCYILHVVEPGTLPRKVLVERRRRLYISYNIEDLIAHHGLTDDDLLPPTTSTSADQFSLYGTASFLPLEVFDDEGFDPCSVEDWLALGKIDGIQHPIPGLGFIPILTKNLAHLKIGKSSMRYTNRNDQNLMAQSRRKRLKEVTGKYQYLWMDVAVTHYNYKTCKWTVLTLDGTQTKHTLPRIYIMFRAEDPVNFSRRVVDAVDRRRHTERLIKFYIYCDCMPTLGLPEIEGDSMVRIHKSVTRNGTVKGVDEIIDKLALDVQYTHKKKLAELSFINVAHSYPEMFTFVELPVTEEIKVPLKSKFDTGMEDYEGIKRILSWSWLYVLDETYLGMMHVVIACLKLNGMSFFSANFGKHISLEEFDSFQSAATASLIKYLRKDWLELITTNVRMCLQDIGKGWFNIKEKNWAVYELSKLSRYMELIKYRMQTALKYLVENSTDLLVKIVETPCQVCLDVEDDFVWGADLVNTQFQPSAPAVFSVFIKMNNIGPYYSTPPENYEDISRGR